MHNIILMAVTSSVVGILMLASVAKLVAYTLGRPAVWERCFQVLLVLSIGALLGAMGLGISPNRIKARSSRHHYPCVANLRLIEGAKAAWALEMKKTPADIPRDVDLFGPARYIRAKPKCPEGGTYRLGAVAEKPTCGLLGGRHSLD